MLIYYMFFSILGTYKGTPIILYIIFCNLNHEKNKFYSQIIKSDQKRRKKNENFMFFDGFLTQGIGITIEIMSFNVIANEFFYTTCMAS